MPNTTSVPPETTAASPDPTRRYRCRHVFTEGHRCGSPALRGQDLCYYHHASRREPDLAGRNGYFLMPRIDDRPSIQIALYDILSRLAQHDIDPKRAGMFLYGLQIASSNIGKYAPSAASEEPMVEDIVSNPFLGDLAPIAEIPDPAEAPAVPEPTASPAIPAPAPTTAAAPGNSTPLTKPVIPPQHETRTKHTCVHTKTPQTSHDIHRNPSPGTTPRPIILAAVQAVAVTDHLPLTTDH